MLAASLYNFWLSNSQTKCNMRKLKIWSRRSFPCTQICNWGKTRFKRLKLAKMSFFSNCHFWFCMVNANKKSCVWHLYVWGKLTYILYETKSHTFLYETISHTHFIWEKLTHQKHMRKSHTNFVWESHTCNLYERKSHIFFVWGISHIYFCMRETHTHNLNEKVTHIKYMREFHTQRSNEKKH